MSFFSRLKVWPVIVLGLSACQAVPTPSQSVVSNDPVRQEDIAARPTPPRVQGQEQASRPVESFKGMKAGDIAALLGDPAVKRRDKPAEIWQYTGGNCVLDIFLYDEAGGIQQVAHAQVRGYLTQGDDKPETTRRCVAELIDSKQRQRPEAG